MTQRRVVGTPGAVRGVSRSTRVATTPPAPPEPPAPRRSNRKLLIAVVLLGALLLGGAGYLAVTNGLLGGDSDSPAETVSEVLAEAEPGELVPVESMTVNLSEGRYLRLAFSMQMVQGATGIDVARAQDTAIDLFAGQDLDQVLDPEVRAELKQTLINRLNDITGGEVLDVYFTDYVTQ